MADHGYEVGQEVCHFPDLKSPEFTTWTIERVSGNILFCGPDGSFYRKSGIATNQDGKITGGRVFPDEATRTAYIEKNDAWHNLQFEAHMQRIPPAHLSAADITDILKKLKGAE